MAMTDQSDSICHKQILKRLALKVIKGGSPRNPRPKKDETKECKNGYSILESRNSYGKIYRRSNRET